MNTTTMFVKEGELLDYTPSVDTKAGEIVIVGTLVTQVVASVLAGELGALRTCGVVRFAKATADVFALGAKVNWNAATKQASIAAATAVAGTAVDGGAAGQDYVDVLINR